MPLQDVDNSDQKAYPAGGPTAFSVVLDIASTVSLRVNESPILSVHRDRTIRGRLGHGCLYWAQKAAAHFPSTAGKKIKTTE
jgi:hypothetical protein